MDCNCRNYIDKELLLDCCRCGGIVKYMKINNVINDKDDNYIILDKLKKDLAEKKIDITILKIEIRDLENLLIN